MDILSAAVKYKMFNPGDMVLVAVSGGPDSVALLHSLHTKADELGIRISAAHLNHGIRGEVSNLDESFVRELTHTWGIPGTFGHADVPALQKELKTSLEAAARIARYNFLYKTAEEIGASKIAVGHNADDRAESVLMNILRGCGIDGLGSIRPVRGNLVRPIIDTSRAEIEAYIKEHSLPYRIDETNQDVTYTRNRIRHELIPLLEEQYNPRVKKSLVRLAEIAAEQSDFMDSNGESALTRVIYRDALDVDMFSELPLSLQHEVLRKEIKRVKGDLFDIEFEQIDMIASALETGADFTFTLPPGDVYVERSGNSLKVFGKKQMPEITPFDYLLLLPGATSIPELGITINAELTSQVKSLKTPPTVALFDADAVKGELRVRNVRHGDRIQPFGMSGTKKLQDVFVDKKIPQEQRARTAVVEDSEKIIWVVGVVASETARVTDKTNKIIRLQVSHNERSRL